MHEVGADKPPHLVGETSGVGNRVRYHHKAAFEDGVEIIVPFLEGLFKLLQRLGHLVGRQLEDPTNQLPDATPRLDWGIVDRQVRLRNKPL